MSSSIIAQSSDTANTKYPIFFLQVGSNRNSFLEKVFQQAAVTNGIENVYILTDTDFDLYKDYKCIDITKYINNNSEFDKVYQHHSTNSYQFEKSCFDRWFILKDVVQELNIPYFFYADCDVLVLRDLTPTFNYMIKHGYEGAMTFVDRENDSISITSAHSSFWGSELLNEFCDFTYNTYTDSHTFNKLLKDTVRGNFTATTMYLT